MSEQDKYEYVRHLSEVGGVTGAMGDYREVFTTEGHLARLKAAKLVIPVLGVTGEFGLPDVGVTPGLYAANVEHAVIKGSRHFVAGERPDDLVRALSGAFIAKQGD